MRRVGRAGVHLIRCLGMSFGGSDEAILLSVQIERAFFEIAAG